MSFRCPPCRIRNLLAVTNEFVDAESRIVSRTNRIECFKGEHNSAIMTNIVLNSLCNRDFKLMKQISVIDGWRNNQFLFLVEFQQNLCDYFHFLLNQFSIDFNFLQLQPQIR